MYRGLDSTMTPLLMAATFLCHAGFFFGVPCGATDEQVTNNRHGGGGSRGKRARPKKAWRHEPGKSKTRRSAHLSCASGQDMTRTSSNGCHTPLPGTLVSLCARQRGFAYLPLLGKSWRTRKGSGQSLQGLALSLARLPASDQASGSFAQR